MIHSCCGQRVGLGKGEMVCCVCVSHKDNTTPAHWINIDVLLFSKHKGTLVPSLPFSQRQTDRQTKTATIPTPIPTKWETIFGLVLFKMSHKLIAQKDEFSLWGCREMWPWIPNERMLQSSFRQNLPCMQNEDQQPFLVQVPYRKQLKVREEERSVLRGLESN